MCEGYSIGARMDLPVTVALLAGVGAILVIASIVIAVGVIGMVVVSVICVLGYVTRPMVVAEQITLYDYPGSPCARRVRATLLSKGIAYNRVVIDIRKMEQRTPAYLAINPNGLVPSLQHGNWNIFESNVITEYLDLAFPSSKQLYPSNPWQRAQTRMLQAFELHFAKDYWPIMYARVIGPVDHFVPLEEHLQQLRRNTNDEAQIERMIQVWEGTWLSAEGEAAHQRALYRHLEWLENYLSEGSRIYLVGTSFSAADISMFPRLSMFPFLQLPLDPLQHAHILRWMAHIRGNHPEIINSLGLKERLLFGMGPSATQQLRSLSYPPPDAGRSCFQGCCLLPAVKLMASRSLDKLWARIDQRYFNYVMRKSVQRAAGTTPQTAVSAPVSIVQQGSQPQSGDPLKLWGCSYDPQTWRLQLLLHMHGLQPAAMMIDGDHGSYGSYVYEEVPLHRLASYSPSYRQKNPLQSTPMITLGAEGKHEFVVFDVHVQMEFLARHLKDDANKNETSARDLTLYGRNLEETMAVKMWQAYESAIAAEFKPLFWQRCVGRIKDEGPLEMEASPDMQTMLKSCQDGTYLTENKMKLLEGQLHIRLAYIEEKLKLQHENGLDFLMGPLSAADLALVTRLMAFELIQLPIEKSRYPHIIIWMECLHQHDKLREGLQQIHQRIDEQSAK
jgi:glutathione S-transferase